jgi:hypothetical protein
LDEFGSVILLEDTIVIEARDLQSDGFRRELDNFSKAVLSTRCIQSTLRHSEIPMVLIGGRIPL